jgi:hypothetical protein
MLGARPRGSADAFCGVAGGSLLRGLWLRLLWSVFARGAFMRSFPVR